MKKKKKIYLKKCDHNNLSLQQYRYHCIVINIYSFIFYFGKKINLKTSVW